MAKAVVRWVTKDRHTGLYLRRGASWAQDRWVRNPVDATLDELRSDWHPEPSERRVKVYLQVQEEAQANGVRS